VFGRSKGTLGTMMKGVQGHKCKWDDQRSRRVGCNTARVSAGILIEGARALKVSVGSEGEDTK